MSIRIEQYDGGEVLYLALDPDGAWSHSEFPDELITLDYNSQGGLIGMELVGSVARRSASGLLEALVGSEADQDLREKISAVLG